MNVFAYTDRRYQNATRKVVGEGATLLTSPPVFTADFNPQWLEGYDLIYLDLHGKPRSVYLYSGQRSGALHVGHVQAANLDGAIIIATTCYLPDTAFLQAFLDSGAAAVIAGGGINWGTRTRISGAQLLASLIIRLMRSGRGVEIALAEAKKRLKFSFHRLKDRAATDDALLFQAYMKYEEQDHVRDGT